MGRSADKQALQAPADFYEAVKNRRAVALSPTAGELGDFAPAFEHEPLEGARASLSGAP